jgi:hypothetical protein
MVALHLPPAVCEALDHNPLVGITGDVERTVLPRAPHTQSHKRPNLEAGAHPLDPNPNHFLSYSCGPLFPSE